MAKKGHGIPGDPLRLRAMKGGGEKERGVPFHLLGGWVAGLFAQRAREKKGGGGGGEVTFIRWREGVSSISAME